MSTNESTVSHIDSDQWEWRTLPGPQVEEREGWEDALGREEDVGPSPPLRPQLAEQIRPEAVAGPKVDVQTGALEVQDELRDAIKTLRKAIMVAFGPKASFVLSFVFMA